MSDLTEQQSNYEASNTKMQKVYMELEAKLEGNVFLNGDQVCVADFAVCSQAIDLALMGISYQMYPNIHRWRRHMITKVPGYKEVMDDFFKRLSRREFPASVQQFELLLSNMPLGKDT